MNIKEIDVPYVLLGLSYIFYYFTHISEIYILIGLIYIFIAFNHGKQDALHEKSTANH